MKWFMFIISILLSAGAFGSPAEENVEKSVPILESAQELLGLNINRIANRFDSFFADQRADDELGRSRIRLRRNYEVRERAIPKEQTQVRINLRLPHLESKFRFYEDNKSKSAPTTPGAAPAEDDPNRVPEDWQFRSDVGVSVKIPPNIFTRARLRKNTVTWKLIHRFIQELTWFSDRDWEESTTLDSDYNLANNMLLRFRNAAEWRITRKKFGTSHGPSIFHQISDNDAISYGVTMSTTVDNGRWFVMNYRVAPTYRRNLYKNWFFLDVIPGLDFPKLWSFRRTPFVFAQLEALFGGN